MELLVYGAPRGAPLLLRDSNKKVRAYSANPQPFSSVRFLVTLHDEEENYA